MDETTEVVLRDFHRAMDTAGDPVAQLYEATKVYAYRHATHRRQAVVVDRDTDCLDEPHRSLFQGRRREHEHAFRAIIAPAVIEGAFNTESSVLGLVRDPRNCA